jgi:ABC-2 type transport system permease protein/sodium transport system permease protein
MNDTNTNIDKTAVPFSFAQQLEFTLKELRETLRDRRTIVTLMAMPLLLYPMLGLGLRFLAFQESSDAQIEYRLAIPSEAEAVWLSETLKLGERLLEASGEAKNQQPAPDVQLLVPNDPLEFDLEGLVQNSAADVGIKVEFDKSIVSNQYPGAARVKVFQSRDSVRSRDAADYVQQRLAAANIDWIRSMTQQEGKPFVLPVEQTRVLLEPTETGSAVLGLLPLILLLMTVTGGVYPAIDLTAGERERNTLETLMALPVPRFRLLLAKFVAVVSVTMLTGLMNLLAMSITLYTLQLDKTLLGGDGFTLGLGLKLFLVLSAFALFYSAVLLLLTSSARSFKEAQAYLIPLLLLSIAPGLVILMPGWNLATGTAALPLVNMLLLSKELLEGSVMLLPAIVAVVSTVLYGAAALAMAAQVFGNDAAAIGSRGRWADFFQQPKTASQQPSITAALVGLAILFPAYFIVSGLLSRGESQPSERLLVSAMMTASLFVGLPWLLMRWQRTRSLSGFGLKEPAWQYYVAAFLLGIATWPWIFELVVFAQSMGIRGIDLSKIENVESLLAGWKEVPLWLVVLCLGVVPGVCEECFFRGYLFNGLKQHLNATWTIVVSAVAFGLFHVVLAGGAAPERLLPSTLMGLLLGWMAYRSGSIVPSILLHAIHNSTLLIVVQSRDLLAEWNIGQVEQVHLPWPWLAASAVVLGAGFLVAILALKSVHTESKEIVSL